MQHKLLSIVIPVFNIEQYIAKCIESFEKVNEKYYSLFELIIVNDGSTDSSLQVIEKILEESSLKARIISKENGGHGSTINVGIKEAKGKYFKVIDGDDWVDVQSFETFLENLSKIDVDMIITNYTEQHIYNQTKKEISFSDKLEQDKVYHGIPFRRIPMHAVTFKTAILKENNIQISEKIFYVDMEYTLLPLRYVNSYIYFNLNIYQYFLGRPDQSMNLNIMRQKSNHHDRVTKRILEYYKFIHLDDKLEPVVKVAVNYLINKQCQLHILNDNIEEIYQLFDYASQCQFKWEYDPFRKTTSFIYINYRCNRMFDLILSPIIKRQRKKWSIINGY